MHDVQLEDRLRNALRADADALPFTITLDQLEWRLRERRRQRFTRQSLTGLAATLALAAIAATVILFANRGDAPPVGTSPSPSIEPSASAAPSLASFDELHRVVGLEARILLRAEQAADPPPVPDQLVSYRAGVVTGDGYYLAVFHCVGEGPFQLTWSDDEANELSSVEQERCPAVPEAFTGADLPTDAWLSVTTSPGTAWRLIVVDPSSPPATPLPEPPEIGSVPEYVELAAVGLAEGSPGATVSVKVPPEADDYLLAVSCIGSGAIEIDTPSVPIRFDCPPDGSWMREDLVVPADRSFDLDVRATGTVRARIVVDAYDWDGNPDAVFIPPAATVSAGAEAVTAELGCGLGFQLASGESGADSCGPDYPVMPLDRTLHVTPGADLVLELADGWTVAAVSGTYAATEAIVADEESVEFVPLDGCCDTGEDEPSQALLRAPTESGDWTLRLSLSGSRGGDAYGVPYHVRVIVGPGSGG